MDEKSVDSLRRKIKKYFDRVKPEEVDQVVFTQTVFDLEGQIKKLEAEIERENNK